MKTALIVAATAAVATANLSEPQTQFLFTQFVQTHNANYETKDFFNKYSVFKQNLDVILAHNANPSKTFTMGVTKFADLTAEEFAARHTMKPMGASLRAKSARKFSSRAKVPASVDWRDDKNVVGAVQDQGQCGSCWAFSAVGAAEGAYGLAKGKFMKFSEQQLVDCAGSEGNNGCNGGLMDTAFAYYEKNGIYETNHYGPYTARDGSCKAITSQADVDGSEVTGYDMVDNNEDALVAAAAQQPVSVAIAASGSAFQFYTSGVITGSACGTQLDHGVLVVGYGTEKNVDYYIVRNSWGASWGEKGYVRIQRGADTCGIDKTSNWNVVPHFA
eukprot:TRINITY_DN1658_c0_g1_i2.p2 TRINITY_DN1658_c0_g1~~TRINITY_DN1658_c0_g1_i2.p2  ORF type:complete len:331 (-),score=47.59 TRINITY_DN1658_c0_g1_i2:199-1191(-)